jgi:Bifunctional DNA primase/polymerase, N-terminal
MTTSRSDLGESALALAAGHPVLPLEPCGKRPLAGLGLRSATQDRETVASWWRCWPTANVGLRCDGLLVFDVDGESGEQSLVRLEERFGPLPRSRVVFTGKGQHHYFRCSMFAGNSTQGLGRPAGIDLRSGTRGYVAAPPSIHASGRRYEWANEDPIAELPQSWLAPLTVFTPAPRPQNRFEDSSTETGYGRQALESELEVLLRAQPGERNETLNRSVFRLAQLVAGGQLTADRVESSARQAALMLGLEPVETAATIRSALVAGRRFPRLPRARA